MMPRGRQREVLAHQPLDRRGRRSSPVPKVSTWTRHRLGDADGVGELHLDALGEAGGDEVLGDVAGHVAGRAVDLRRDPCPEKAPPP